MTENSSRAFELGYGETTPRDRRNLRWLLVTCVLWAACLLGAAFLIKREILVVGPLAWGVALLPTVVGVVVILAYRRYLREADELQRFVQLQAMAIGFGAGWVAICGYPLLERLGAPPVDPGTYAVVMAVFYSLGSVIGSWRYR